MHNFKYKQLDVIRDSHNNLYQVMYIVPHHTTNEHYYILQSSFETHPVVAYVSFVENEGNFTLRGE